MDIKSILTWRKSLLNYFKNQIKILYQHSKHICKLITNTIITNSFKLFPENGGNLAKLITYSPNIQESKDWDF